MGQLGIFSHNAGRYKNEEEYNKNDKELGNTKVRVLTLHFISQHERFCKSPLHPMLASLDMEREIFKNT